jgi:hypothetical protein
VISRASDQYADEFRLARNPHLAEHGLQLLPHRSNNETGLVSQVIDRLAEGDAARNPSFRWCEIEQALNYLRRCNLWMRNCCNDEHAGRSREYVICYASHRNHVKDGRRLLRRGRDRNRTHMSTSVTPQL